MECTLKYIKQSNSQRQRAEWWLSGTGDRAKGGLLLNQGGSSVGADEISEDGWW